MTAPDPAPQRIAAETAWGARVRRHHEQTARVRETPEGGDFYAPVSRLFLAEPRRSDDAILDILLSLVRTGESWLDIGAGAGRYALPLALRADRVVAIDPSLAMLQALRKQAAEHGIANVQAVEARWPLDPARAPVPAADAALVANLGYDVEEIGPFLDAVEAAAGRLCVAILADRQPSVAAHVFWPPVHGEERAELPAFDDLLALLRARGRSPREERVPRPTRGFADRAELLAWLRNQLFLEPGSAKDQVLERELDRRLVAQADGTVGLGSQAPMATGIAWWEPV
jgi:SAM-dependent methyltransferase